MKFNDLTTKANRKSSRVGRGISAGKGKTAGRGTKGQGSRKSGGVRPGFEGGQMPLYMRIPKLRGFRSFKKPTITVYTGQLDALGVNVDTQALADAGIIENSHLKVKLVLKGDVKKKHTVSLQAASKSAIAALEKAGGSFKAVDQLKRPASTRKTTKK